MPTGQARTRVRGRDTHGVTYTCSYNSCYNWYVTSAALYSNASPHVRATRRAGSQFNDMYIVRSYYWHWKSNYEAPMHEARECARVRVRVRARVRVRVRVRVPVPVRVRRAGPR